MKKILIVDDSSVVRMSLDMLLKENNYDVDSAANGLEGLGAIEASKYNLIITDINMPKMDGLEMMKRARELPSAKFTPILVLTTESDSEMLEKGKEFGATGWIVKPFTNEDLLATVNKVIS